MKKLKNNPKSRLVILFIGIFVFAIICAVQLFNLQIVKGDSYKQIISTRSIRSFAIKAPRGEIFDRYGRPMVTNSMGFYVQIQDLDLSDEELNKTVAGLVAIAKEDEIEYINEFPLAYPYYNFKYQTDDKKAELIKWRKEHKLDKFSTVGEIMSYYRNRYGISSKYEDEEAFDIIAVRYTMEEKLFNSTNPFTFAVDVDMDAVQKIEENYGNLLGVSVEIEPKRSYVNGSLASHILGRTGIIYKEEYDVLKDEGYGMNDIIGKDGIEKVLEPYLKGKDGYKQVEQTKVGDISQVLMKKQPETDYYAMLTIDSRLQEVAEKSLEKNIKAAGNDAKSGAAVCIDVKTGEVLAMASYPGYQPDEYNKNYDALLKDESKPLFNRALNGAYTPGSTFKPLTSIAALESGTIEPNTKIYDAGKYMYYAPSYTPTCLIWRRTGETHGTINVSEAIGVSCNYFYYEVGRLMGIETINKYAYMFGLGETTGIELSETTGIVAGPDYRDKLGLEWYPGDTLQAAIGQSDNMYTPAQLASYVATIINGGKRYGLHLVKEVRRYDNGETVMEKTPEVLSDNPIEQTTVDAVLDGMKRVTADGTAKAVFEDFPVAVGGKTGTAEVSRGSDNVLFVGFAPYENPQIAVAIVIEHGASSSFAASVGRDIFEYYLGLGSAVSNVQSYNSLIK